MPHKEASLALSDARLNGSSDTKQVVRACLIGGKQLHRLGVAALLKQNGLTVPVAHEREEDLILDTTEDGDLPYDLIIVLLAGKGPFAAIHRIRESLGQLSDIPLVILSEHVGRGQVYAALRIGAKAYLDLDCTPQELAVASRMAAAGKVYLSPDVAELLVNDVSDAVGANGTQRLPSAELSRREVEIVQLLCEGMSSKEIARRLHLSAKTVENHRYNIYRKCDVDSIAALMRIAIQQGLVSI